MIKANNPAARLHIVFSQIRKKPDKTSLKDALIEIFNLQPNSTPQLFHIIIKLTELLQNAKNAIEKLDIPNKELYLKPFPNFETLLSMTNLNVGISSTRSLLNDVNMNTLEFCSAKLSEGITEKPISEKKISDIQKEIEKLIEGVLEATSISNDLQRIILQKLRAIHFTILNYRIFGSEAIKEELESIIGSYIVNNPLYKSNEKSEELNSFWKLVAKISNLLSTVTNLKRLSEPYIPALMEAIKN